MENKTKAQRLSEICNCPVEADHIWHYVPMVGGAVTRRDWEEGFSSYWDDMPPGCGWFVTSDGKMRSPFYYDREAFTEAKCYLLCSSDTKPEVF